MSKRLDYNGTRRVLKEEIQGLLDRLKERLGNDFDSTGLDTIDIMEALEKCSDWEYD